MRARRLARCPGVEKEAVFAHGPLVHVLLRPRQVAADDRLNTGRNRPQRLTNPTPARYRLRLAPTQFSRWWCGERYTPVYHHVGKTLRVYAPYTAVVGFDDGRVAGGRCFTDGQHRNKHHDQDG